MPVKVEIEYLPSSFQNHCPASETLRASLSPTQTSSSFSLSSSKADDQSWSRLLGTLHWPHLVHGGLRVSSTQGLPVLRCQYLILHLPHEHSPFCMFFLMMATVLSIRWKNSGISVMEPFWSQVILNIIAPEKNMVLEGHLRDLR